MTPTNTSTSPHYDSHLPRAACCPGGSRPLLDWRCAWQAPRRPSCSRWRWRRCSSAVGRPCTGARQRPPCCRCRCGTRPGPSRPPHCCWRDRRCRRLGTRPPSCGPGYSRPRVTLNTPLCISSQVAGDHESGQVIVSPKLQNLVSRLISRVRYFVFRLWDTVSHNNNITDNNTTDNNTTDNNTTDNDDDDNKLYNVKHV